MTEAIADTSLFIAGETGRALRVEAIPERLGVSCVTIGELRAGVLMAADLEARDRRLRTLLAAMALEPLQIDDQVVEAWARLRVDLHRRGQRMPANDSWIAATAIALGVPVITQDDDYVDVPGLTVISV